MKKSVILFLLFLALNSITPAQTKIENPKKPLNSHAGREMSLEEIMQINDVGGEFFFKYPTNLKVSANGFIFIEDMNQLLQFDSEGKFIRNFYKKGQGPGEMLSIGNVVFHGDHLIVHDSWSNKIMLFYFNGERVDEFRIRENTNLSRFLLSRDDKYYFLSSERPMAEKTSIVDLFQKIIRVSEKGDEVEELTQFPTKGYIVVGKQGSRIFYDISSVITVPFRDKYLFVSHTREYLVKLYDVENDKVIRSFNRKYKRIKTLPDEKRRGGASMGGKPVYAPRQKYKSDIQNLLVYKDNLWVVTSTKDKEGKTLVDVYDIEGKYIDNFYIKLPEGLVKRYHGDTSMAVFGDYIYILEKNRDETFSIKKYRIEQKKEISIF